MALRTATVHTDVGRALILHVCLLLPGLIGAAVAPEPPAAGKCPHEGIAISGGSVLFHDDGSGLEYLCPAGYYPFPVQTRVCRGSGTWSPMRDQQGGLHRTAECRLIRCPGPVDFENGEYWPRARAFNVSQVLTFQCYDGYTLRGSGTRTCLPSGKWDGQTAICDGGASHCRNPGIPIGTRKTGWQYRWEDSVTYRCAHGLTLQGSQKRTCMDDGSWSGTEPSCRGSYMYDTPDEVSSAFISSLTEALEGADAASGQNPGDQQKRRILIDPAGSMNIYLVMDASSSIGSHNFTGAKRCLNSLIEKVASYGVKPRYGVLTYATNTQIVVRTTDDRSSDADWVSQQLENIKYSDHKQVPGTNTYKALMAVYNMMISQEKQDPKGWNITRHVILLMTDGNYNMGGTPERVIADIREFLNIGRNLRNPREDYLDIYVFGIGPLVDQEKINALASKKSGETHVFKVKDMQDLEKTFHMMIDESQTLGLCGVGWEFDPPEVSQPNSPPQRKYPWQASITITRPPGMKENCKGTVVSPYFILTAAHCFNVDDEARNIKVSVGEGRDSDTEHVHFHPEYDVNKKKGQGISEFYDYDVALIQLHKKLVFSPNVRPVCLPCTAGTTRALRLPLPSTCRHHAAQLLPVGNVKAMFITDGKTASGKKVQNRNEVLIKNGEKKSGCEEDARHAQGYENIKQISDVVTPNFLCTGGSDPVADPNTCKGDSGGPLIIHQKSRFIQVGVISWGVIDVCKEKGKPIPSFARDFHFNLFSVIPWLKKILKEEDLGFL
ncbi:complement factor B [Tachyglossus aculeatus]|uniref:complement factor B n=1 Tax=Tachyglossus aculeatus TaxID=9261 RepID=UPI0018F58AA2|nr:complement factor B [Tachyglossus aculeatus]